MAVHLRREASFFNIRTDFRAFDPNYEMSYFDFVLRGPEVPVLIPNRSDFNYARGYYPTKYEEVQPPRRHALRLLPEFNYELGKWLGIGFDQRRLTGGLSTLALDGDQNPDHERERELPGPPRPAPPVLLLVPWHVPQGRVPRLRRHLQLLRLERTLLLATARFRPFNLIGIYAGLQEAWFRLWTGLYELVPAIQAGLDISYEF